MPRKKIEDPPPEYPRDLDNPAKVFEWVREMKGYLIENQLIRAATDGKAQRYPPSILNITDEGSRRALMAEEDADEVSKVFSIILKATKKTAPALHNTLMSISTANVSMRVITHAQSWGLRS